MSSNTPPTVTSETPLLGTPLAQRVVLITGASSGIGLACVHTFLGLHSLVAALDITGHSALPSSASILPLTCDITSAPAVAAAVAAVIAHWGRIDVLVNNAGIADDLSPAGAVTSAVWTRTLDVNVTGMFTVTQAALPHLRANADGGAIVNVGSAATQRGGLAGAAYTASKHAVVGLTKNTAWHLQYGPAEGGGRVTCNVVHPGAVATGIVGSAGVPVSEVGLEGCKPMHAIMPQPPVGVEDVARAVAWVAGNRAVNGADLVVDGGWTV
ncbi:NAD(P)-binding protein [Geopyxis carbonaria]|nr:NAD(P)-binding protein [Geopyxis carbonaria]